MTHDRRSSPSVRCRAASPARATALVALLAATALPAPVRAQTAVAFPQLANIATDATVLCNGVTSLLPSGAGSAVAADSARRLADAAAVASLGGELVRARGLLRQASALDPSSAELAFRLARVADEMDDPATAIAANCLLRRNSTDAQQRTDAETLLRTYAVRRGVLPPETVIDRFRGGIADATSGALVDAEHAFDDVVARAPAFATAYYDRGVIRLARGRAAQAEDDLRRFAALAPTAIGPSLRDAQRVLERGQRSPATALGLGIIFPGGAQYYSGRPVPGVLVGAAVAAGVVLAFQSETRLEERTFTDPFGIPYTDRVPVTVHPRRTLGFSIAGGVMLAGALEGLLRVNGDRGALSRLTRRVHDALSAASGGR